jgi:hypothetical protein
MSADDPKSTNPSPVKAVMPSGAAMTIASLGATLKKPPAKAKTKRIGIVAPAAKAADPPGVAQTADGLKFPANSGEKDTNVASHGGALASGVAVQLIFWGNSWNTSDTTLRNQIENATLNLVQGPFSSALGQYGLAGPTWRGSTTVTSPAPPGTFDDSTIGDLVWNCMDANIFPEPDDPGGRNYYCVLMPPGTTYGPGGALGAHSHPTDYDFPFDFDTAGSRGLGTAT